MPDRTSPLQSFFADTRGTVPIEYGVIAAGICGAIFVVYGQVGDEMNALFTSIKDAVASFRKG
ncbi:MAG: Flp family type IVb pilin [Pseudomonadota bacterium]